MSKTKPFGASRCPNCGEYGSHFVSPSLGEPGFFICKKKEDNMDLHISHKISLKDHCVNRVMGLWSKRTKASKTAKEYIFREWRRGTLDLRINRDDFVRLTKEIDAGGIT